MFMSVLSFFLSLSNRETIVTISIKTLLHDNKLLNHNKMLFSDEKSTFLDLPYILIKHILTVVSLIED